MCCLRIAIPAPPLPIRLHLRHHQRPSRRHLEHRMSKISTQRSAERPVWQELVGEVSQLPLEPPCSPPISLVKQVTVPASQRPVWMVVDRTPRSSLTSVQRRTFYMQPTLPPSRPTLAHTHPRIHPIHLTRRLLSPWQLPADPRLHRVLQLALPLLRPEHPLLLHSLK